MSQALSAGGYRSTGRSHHSHHLENELKRFPAREERVYAPYCYFDIGFHSNQIRTSWIYYRQPRLRLQAAKNITDHCLILLTLKGYENNSYYNIAMNSWKSRNNWCNQWKAFPENKQTKSQVTSSIILWFICSILLNHRY